MIFKNYEPGQNPNPGPVVTIICSAESHARGKVANIESFIRRPGLEWATQRPPTLLRGKPGDLDTKQVWSLQELNVKDLPLTEEEFDAILERKAVGFVLRKRFTLYCKLCRYSLPVRDKKLFPKLDILARHAHESIIELSEFAAIMRK